jgi:DNA invertase Pin-like site-specific DNA recombinase
MSSIASQVLTSVIIQRVADYARLSEDDAKDPDLRGENVGIQLDECEIFRTSRPDWQHVGSFKDNDISASAFSSDTRPDFEKLMKLVRASQVDVILCVEVTRLFRKPLEAEVLVDLVWSKSTSFHTIVTTRGGYYDLRTSAGRKAVRDAVNAAAGESDNISDRVRLKKAALARKGKPNGGRRVYGYAKDQITQVPEEVEILHEAAKRVMTGESMRHILGDFNERGVPTTEGKLWYKPTLSNMLKRKRYCAFDDSGKGIREHNGAEYKAVWDAVFDRKTFECLQAALRADEHLAARRGKARKYLLVGFAYCGECGRKLGGAVKRDRPTQPKRPRYVCRPYDAQGRRTGCSKVSRGAEPLEDFITDCVLARFDGPDFTNIFAEESEDSEQLATHLDEHQTQKQKLDQLIDDFFGDNPDHLDRAQFMRAKLAAETTLRRISQEIESLSAKRAAGILPIGQTIRETWEKNADLGWRRQIIGLIVDKIFVHAGGGKPLYKGRWKFDPNQIEIIWKA